MFIACLDGMFGHGLLFVISEALLMRLSLLARSEASKPESAWHLIARQIITNAADISVRRTADPAAEYKYGIVLPACPPAISQDAACLDGASPYSMHLVVAGCEEYQEVVEDRRSAFVKKNNRCIYTCEHVEARGFSVHVANINVNRKCI